MAKKTREQFIIDANTTHNNYYTYENCDYVFAKDKVTVTCPSHGNFRVTANNHLSKKSGCNKCAVERVSKSQKKTKSQFVQEANLVHNNFYSYEDGEYDSARRPITITCPEHGNFEQIPTNHLKGVGCPSCHGGMFNANKETILYFLEIDGGICYKIGITCKTVNERFHPSERASIKVLHTWVFPNGREAYNMEQYILDKFKIHKYDGDSSLLNGKTELFNKNISNEINNILKETNEL